MPYSIWGANSTAWVHAILKGLLLYIEQSFKYRKHLPVVFYSPRWYTKAQALTCMKKVLKANFLYIKLNMQYKPTMFSETC